MNAIDSAVRARPGYVVDSALPMDELLRRFRVGIDTIPTTLNGPASREGLVKAFFAALEKKDGRALQMLAVSRAEYAYIVFPDSKLSKPPYNQPPEIGWLLLQNGSAVSRLIDRIGGGQVKYVSHGCPEPDLDGTLRVYNGCTVRTMVNGEYTTARLFGAIIERGGRFKFLSFANDF